MQALAFDRFGDPDVLRIVELPDPATPPGHVQLEMAAIGVNFADIYRRQGRYPLAGPAPHIAGYEGAGRVVSVGPDVREFMVGDRVGFADTPFANATRVLVPVDRAIPLPDDVGFDVAAALLLQGLTAQYLSEDSFRIGSGQHVLVHAAAGGVGQALTRLAAHRGAHVLALASSQAKRVIAQACGAAHVLDPAGDWPEEVRRLTDGGADVAYDSVGTTLAASLSAVRPHGVVALFGMAGGAPPPIAATDLLFGSRSIVGADLWDHLVDREARRDRAARLFAAWRAGVVPTPSIEAFPLSRGADAHRRLEDRAFAGKVLLVPDRPTS